MKDELKKLIKILRYPRLIKLMWNKFKEQKMVEGEQASDPLELSIMKLDKNDKSKSNQLAIP